MLESKLQVREAVPYATLLSTGYHLPPGSAILLQSQSAVFNGALWPVIGPWARMDLTSSSVDIPREYLEGGNHVLHPLLVTVIREFYANIANRASTLYAQPERGEVFLITRPESLEVLPLLREESSRVGWMVRCDYALGVGPVHGPRVPLGAPDLQWVGPEPDDRHLVPYMNNLTALYLPHLRAQWRP